MAGQPGFFDLSDRYEALSVADDPFKQLAAVVDFEVFRGPPVAALRRSPRGKDGRPPFDPVLMFKILILQALYSLSNEGAEFQINGRLSFQCFLDLGLGVPDATTVWLFRERLRNATFLAPSASPGTFLTCSGHCPSRAAAFRDRRFERN